MISSNIRFSDRNFMFSNDKVLLFLASTEKWVKDSVIALLVLVGVLLVIVVGLSVSLIRHRRRHGYDKI